jgi:hypothetical protein
VGDQKLSKKINFEHHQFSNMKKGSDLSKISFEIELEKTGNYKKTQWLQSLRSRLQKRIIIIKGRNSLLGDKTHV